MDRRPLGASPHGGALASFRRAEDAGESVRSCELMMKTDTPRTTGAIGKAAFRHRVQRPLDQAGTRWPRPHHARAWQQRVEDRYECRDGGRLAESDVEQRLDPPVWVPRPQRADHLEEPGTWIGIASRTADAFARSIASPTTTRPICSTSHELKELLVVPDESRQSNGTWVRYR